MARDEQLGGHVDDVPDHLRQSIQEVRSQAADLREALAEIEGPERPEAPDRQPDEAVPVPGSLVEELDAGIARVRAEIAEIQDRFARSSNGAEPEAPAQDDDDRACMIALNMALNGASRAETERYLDETFCLPDRDRIVDGAYERVQRLGGRPPSPYDSDEC